jgi:hypothetical protein
MEFKTRISYKFASMLVMALALAVFGFFYFDDIYGSANLIYILLWLFVVIRLMFYRRYIYLYLSKKPALVTSEKFIYDVVKRIKYDRIDIETTYADNGYLYIQLHDPAVYLKKIGDPAWRLMINFLHEPNSEKKPFKIDLDLIKIGDDEVTEIIESYEAIDPAEENNTDVSEPITYRFKWGRSAGFLAFQLILFSAIVALNFFGSHKDYYLAFFILFVAIVTVLPQVIKFFYFWIGNKPVLTANRSFIFDQFKNIKYYWNDIDEIVVTGEYMAVKLYHPEKYLDEVRNPVQRFFKKWRYNRFHKKPNYGINMDIISVRAEEYNNFLNTLNQFSIADN